MSRLSQEIEQICAKLLIRYHLKKMRVCGADNPDVKMLGFMNVEQYRLLVECQQLQVLKEYSSSVGVSNVAFHTIVCRTSIRRRVVFADMSSLPASITMIGFWVQELCS